MEKIIIYTSNGCSYCKKVKEEFNENNIEFEERTGKDWEKEWQEVINLTGMPTVPTIEYNNEYFVPARDFGNEKQLISMLNSFTNSPHEQSKRTFERVKTLNYNMGKAFQRLDQLLKQIENTLNIK